MRDGWRRCDAEAIDVVRLALTHAGDPKQSRTWAVRAAKALATEPVMLGAIHRLASEHETAGAALRLLLAAPTDQGLELARFFNGAAKASVVERLLEEHYLEDLDDEDYEEGID